MRFSLVFSLCLIEYESISRFYLFLWFKIMNCVRIVFYSIKYRHVPSSEWSCIRIKHPDQRNVMSSILNYIWKQPLLWKMDEWMREKKLFNFFFPHLYHCHERNIMFRLTGGFLPQISALSIRYIKS